MIFKCWWWYAVVVTAVTASSDWMLHLKGGGPLESRCPCLPPGQCPRPFGSDPDSDYKAFGQIPICKDSRLVRCCGASFRVEMDVNEDRTNIDETTPFENENESTTTEENYKTEKNIFIIYANEKHSRKEDPVYVVLPESKTEEKELEQRNDNFEETTIEMDATTVPVSSSTESVSSLPDNRSSIRAFLARQRRPLKNKLFTPSPQINTETKTNQSVILDLETRASEIANIRHPPRILPSKKLQETRRQRNVTQSQKFGERIRPRERSITRTKPIDGLGNRLLQQMSNLHHTIMSKLGFETKQENEGVNESSSPESSPLPLHWLRSPLSNTEAIFHPVIRSGGSVNVVGPLPPGFRNPTFGADPLVLELPKVSQPEGPFKIRNLLPERPPKPPPPPEDIGLNISDFTKDDLKENEKAFLEKQLAYKERQEKYFNLQMEYYQSLEKYYKQLQDHIEKIRTIGA